MCDQSDFLPNLLLQTVSTSSPIACPEADERCHYWRAVLCRTNRKRSDWQHHPVHSANGDGRLQHSNNRSCRIKVAIKDCVPWQSWWCKCILCLQEMAIGLPTHLPKEDSCSSFPVHLGNAVECLKEYRIASYFSSDLQGLVNSLDIWGKPRIVHPIFVDRWTWNICLWNAGLWRNGRSFDWTKVSQLSLVF